MTYTEHNTVAKLKLENVCCPLDVVQIYVDWIANHEEEAPEDFIDYSPQDIIAELIPYVECDEHGNVVIKLDSQGDHNWNREFFDYLTDHFKGIMSSQYMVVDWRSYDFKNGLSSGRDYYDKNGYARWTYLEKDSDVLDKIASLLSGTEWDVDMLVSIRDLVTSTGREIKDLE